MRIRTTMAVAATTLLVALGTPFAVAQDSDDVSDTTTITETDTVIEEVARGGGSGRGAARRRVRRQDAGTCGSGSPRTIGGSTSRECRR